MKSLSPFGKLLTALLVFIGLLIFFRMLYSGTRHYLFLEWNIFLAWIPYILSTQFSFYSAKARWKQLFLFGSWLLFFPNALYIVTDLVHLSGDSNMPWWFDAMLVFSAAFVGLLMAFVSLLNTERYLSSIFNHNTVQLVTFGLLFLGSFGVYLGRFERWNSWNILNDPWELGINILGCFLNPVDNIRVWAITILFTAVYSLLYYCLRILPKVFAENNGGRRFRQ
jgi:uncharacterized membrane protein